MRERRTRPLIAVALIACVCGVAAMGQQRGGESKKMSGNAEQLVVSFDFVRLMERLQPALKLAERTVTVAGVLYRFAGEGAGGRLFAVVAVYPDEAQALAAVENQIARTSVGPSHRDRSEHYDLVQWKAEDQASGAMLLRRANTVVRFLGDLPWSERLHLMEQIDQALQSGAPEVTLGATVAAPEITGVKLPDRISAGSRVEAEIEVANIAPVDALFGSENSNALISAGAKPMLTYYAPAKSGRDNIVLIIATPGNLLNRKAIAIDVR